MASPGLIPARAGTTFIRRNQICLRRAHPRSRGDHTRSSRSERSISGSSPLARGPPVLLTSADPRTGLIPARAGTTSSETFTKLSPRAHPRSRGDHGKERIVIPVAAGSSPLARGPPWVRGVVWRRRGLIPARAGTTKEAEAAHLINRAHPRSRGDHRTLKHRLMQQPGSSPLARGPLCRRDNDRHVHGLIPARAGTTQRDLCFEGRTWAHPRSRGDHDAAVGFGVSCEGSSPLARGPHLRVNAGGIAFGLIPARAGTTVDCLDRLRPGGAHPRSRGDH